MNDGPNVNQVVGLMIVIMLGITAVNGTDPNVPRDSTSVQAVERSPGVIQAQASVANTPVEISEPEPLLVDSVSLNEDNGEILVNLRSGGVLTTFRIYQGHKFYREYTEMMLIPRGSRVELVYDDGYIRPVSLHRTDE